MAVTNDQINAWLAANPGATDAQISAAMGQFGVTPEQVASATGDSYGDVAGRYVAANPTAKGYADALSDAQMQTQLASYGHVDNPYGTSPGVIEGEFVEGKGGLVPIGGTQFTGAANANVPDPVVNSTLSAGGPRTIGPNMASSRHAQQEAEKQARHAANQAAHAAHLPIERRHQGAMGASPNAPANIPGWNGLYDPTAADREMGMTPRPGNPTGVAQNQMPINPAAPLSNPASSRR